MALEDDVTDRIPNQTLVELTQDDPEDTTINTTILGLAARDVEASFTTYAGVTYDGTIATHLQEAVDGVLLKLLSYKFEANGIKLYNEWKERLHKIFRITQGGQDRVKPKSSSNLAPSAEVAAPGKFDVETAFQDYIPDGNSRRNRQFPGD